MQLIKTAKLINFELYNLRDDLGQEKDLAKTEPERLAKLKAMLVKKYREVQKEGPTWQLGPRRKKQPAKKAKQVPPAGRDGR